MSFPYSHSSRSSEVPQVRCCCLHPVCIHPVFYSAVTRSAQKTPRLTCAVIVIPVKATSSFLLRNPKESMNPTELSTVRQNVIFISYLLKNLCVSRISFRRARLAAFCAFTNPRRILLSADSAFGYSSTFPGSIRHPPILHEYSFVYNNLCTQLSFWKIHLFLSICSIDGISFLFCSFL